MEELVKIEEVRGLIIEALGRSVGIYGMNETIGRIYGLLYFKEEPLSLEGIALELGVSKATISINIRILVNLKMVSKVWQKGSRKDYYQAEQDFEKITQEVLKLKVANEINIYKEAIEKAVKEYNKLLERETGKIAEIAVKDLGKVMNMARWLKTAARWVDFLMETEVSEGPTTDIEQIEIEWDD